MFAPYLFLIQAAFALVILPAAPAGAADSVSVDLNKAYSHYHNGNTRAAVTILTEAVKEKHKKNARAHYYLGNAWMKLGNAAYARHYYKRTLELEPGEPLAGYCRAALGKHAPAVGAAGKKSPAPSKSNLSSSKKDRVSLSLEDKGMIKVFQDKKTANTNFVFSEVAAALNCLSKKTKKKLREKGCRILIAPTILAARPELRGVKPRGYLHGGGYDNCPGMFEPSTKTLYIPERASWRNSPPQLNKWAQKVSLHELGHAFDFCLSNESDKATFKTAVKKDHQRLTNTLRNKYWYYTQPGAGESELFAELFSVIHGPDVRLNDPNMLKVFPRTTEHIKGLLN